MINLKQMKKSYIYLVLVFGIVMSCSSGGGPDEEVVKPAENTAPTVPIQLYPTNNTLCIDNNVVFTWEASTDAEGNNINYTIEVAENNSFSPILYSESSFSESKLIVLTKGNSYYWRIKSVDNKNAESAYSSINQFITEGDGVSNHVPFAPSLLAPALDTEINGTSTVLRWSASDVDGDALKYDVYLDTTPEPTTKVAENQSETTFNATGLAVATTYYFKVVVKDNKGASSIGQIWNFTTK